MTALVLIAAAVVQGGCGDVARAGPHARNPPYDWGIYNVTAHRWVGWKSRATCIQDGRTTNIVTSGIQHPGLDPIPDVVHLHWVEEPALLPDPPSTTLPTAVRFTPTVAHDADVALHGHIPDEAHFSGILWIVVTDSGATLVPETPQQISARAETNAVESRQWRLAHYGPVPRLDPDGRWRLPETGQVVDRDGSPIEQK